MPVIEIQSNRIQSIELCKNIHIECKYNKTMQSVLSSIIYCKISLLKSKLLTLKCNLHDE